MKNKKTLIFLESLKIQNCVQCKRVYHRKSRKDIFISFQHEEGFFYVTVYLLYVQVGFKQTIASDQELSLLRRGVGGSAAYSNRRSRYSQSPVPTLLSRFSRYMLSYFVRVYLEKMITFGQGWEFALSLKNHS